MVKVPNCDLEVSEFEFQSHYYVRFPVNTLRKGMKSLIPPAMGLIVSMLFVYEGSFLH